MRRSWIKIETNTPDKPEICVIASQLRLDTDAVMGKLVRLWAWAELNVSDRNETSVTAEFLDKVAGKKGFSAALEKAGWLQRKGEGLIFPNFERHNGRAAKGRAQTALRVSRHRKRKSEGEDTGAEEALHSAPDSATFEARNSENEVLANDVKNHDNSLNDSDKDLECTDRGEAQLLEECAPACNDEMETSLPENTEPIVTLETIIGVEPEAEVASPDLNKRKVSRADVKAELAGQKLLF